MNHPADIQEWQHLARDLAAHDLGTDRQDDDPDWTDWADSNFGAKAREHIVLADSQATYRFGPDPLPQPAPQRPALTLVTDQPETAEAFARSVQHIITTFTHNVTARNDRLADLAVDYAAQFLPAGIQFPTVESGAL